VAVAFLPLHFCRRCRCSPLLPTVVALHFCRLSLLSTSGLLITEFQTVREILLFSGFLCLFVCLYSGELDLQQWRLLVPRYWFRGGLPVGGIASWAIDEIRALGSAIANVWLVMFWSIWLFGFVFSFNRYFRFVFRFVNFVPKDYKKLLLFF
jgi:hypothetical protein